MDLSYLPIAVGVIGFGLMTAAFVMIARRGGWQQAMQADAQGRWPLPRYLMLAGASLCWLFPLLTAIPGAVPWWDYSKWYTRFPALGAALGAAFVGIAVVRRRRGG